MVWAGVLLHAFKHEGYDAAWEQLVAWRSGWRGPKRVAADALLNYVCERRDNAEAVMALESLRESGLWKTYWETQIPAMT